VCLDCQCGRPGGTPGRAEIVNVWITGLAGLRGAGLWSGYCACLCRLEGLGPAGWRSEIVRVWISSMAGLGGVAQQRS
jgi:hypothetical protein